MPRGFLSAGERERLSTFPADISDWDLGRFFTLSAHDLEMVEQQRGDDNRLGFALQLCTLRYLGFIPQNLLEPPPTIVRLLAHQLAVAVEALDTYGEREQTRTDHLVQVMDYLGYRRAGAEDMATLEDWLVERALEHDRPTFLLHTAAERLRWDQILRPGLTVLERIVGTARERARTITFEHMAHLFTAPGKRFLDQLLDVPEDDYRTPLTWLQRMPNDHTSTQIKATLEKIHFLQEAGVADWDLSAVNPNRLKYLANIGARATNQHLQRSAPVRRYPILVAFLKQTLFDLTDIVADLFDANLWERHTDAKAELDQVRLQAARSTNEKLRTYRDVVSIVIDGLTPLITSVNALLKSQVERQRLCVWSGESLRASCFIHSIPYCIRSRRRRGRDGTMIARAALEPVFDVRSHRAPALSDHDRRPTAKEVPCLRNVSLS